MQTNKRMLATDRVKKINRISWITIVVNVLLSGFKLVAGIFANSGAMISDAVHSFSDVLSTFVVIIGVRLAGKKDDKDHNYGHEKIESIAGILLAVMLTMVALLIGWNGIGKVQAALRGELTSPGMLAAIAAVSSIAIKEWMYHYTLRAANRLQSTALKADAWHHRSDAFSSIGSLVGIVGALLGFPILDPIASVVICLFIIKVSFDIFRESIGQITDKAADQETFDKIKTIIQSTDGVTRVDELKTRIHASMIFIDVEIAVNANLSVTSGHDIATAVHNRVENKIEKVKHINVHVNPA